jgi:RND superfamily putative drug exporter
MPPGRGRKTAGPLAVVFLWLVVAGIFSVFSAKLNGVTRDDSAAFSSSSAESTQVNTALKRFEPVPTEAAVVVYVRDSGITASDQARIAADAAAFASVPGVSGQVAPPLRAADGKAMQVVVPVTRHKQADAAATVAKLRAQAYSGDGLQVYVAGQAGLDADFASVLKSVDVTLLLAAGIVVIVILVLVYRSPLLWVAPVFSTLFGLSLAQGILYLLVRYAHLVVDPQSASILLVLGFGAGTDYALLLISRLREELRHTADRHTAARAALRSSRGALIASGLTVTAALLCLLTSSLQSDKTLGLTAAITIVCCLVSTLTFLPALLALTGRRIFWPYVPVLGVPARPRRIWGRIAGLVGRRPGWATVVSTLVLALLALGALQLKASGIAQTDAFIHKVDSAVGQQVLGEHYPAGAGSPALVIVDVAHADAVAGAARGVPGVDHVDPLGSAVDGRTRLAVTLAYPPDGEAALSTVARLRAAVRSVSGATALVGGESAVYLDQQDAGARDRNVVIPLVLALIFLILIGLLRAIVASVALLATVVLSFLATLGVSALVFNQVFHFAGADPSYPLYVFVFLVALGVDYNIFLMARIREEAAVHGTREGTLRGLTLTGSVITSSGLVLAATFATLGVLPLVFFATVGFSVAFGVLLDTFLVRSVLVPSVVLLLRRVVWWPSRSIGVEAPGSGSAPKPHSHGADARREVTVREQE